MLDVVAVSLPGIGCNHQQGSEKLHTQQFKGALTAVTAGPIGGIVYRAGWVDDLTEN